MTTYSLYLIFLGIGALLIGSFLNVVIYRLPRMIKAEWRTECEALLNPQKTHQSKTSIFNLAYPRSSCPHCRKVIPFWHNIPILSFILLKGRCSLCKKSISWQYPLIESLCFILSLIAGLYFGFNLTLIFALLFIWMLLSLTVIDLQHQLLPDSLTLGLLWLGLLANIGHLFTPLPDAVLGAVSGYLALWLVMKLFYYCTGKIGMGNGDFKLLAAFGAWFGWMLLPLLLLMASLMGAIAGIIYLKATKKSKETPIPFGPFLCLAGFIVLFFGKTIAPMLGVY
ncbi:MAG: A24 family peptidase [Gammaproteobacteria bacterium]|nr:A24 family peptidase [Gammaproteobacteria bacterium]